MYIHLILKVHLLHDFIILYLYHNPKFSEHKLCYTIARSVIFFSYMYVQLLFFSYMYVCTTVVF